MAPLTASAAQAYDKLRTVSMFCASPSDAGLQKLALDDFDATLHELVAADGD